MLNATLSVIFKHCVIPQKIILSFYYSGVSDVQKDLSQKYTWLFFLDQSSNWEVINNFFDFFHIIFDRVKFFAQIVILQV